jgi:probable phosphoglycerate mutase
VTAPTSVIVEADGGSRGNPGPAAYGAVLRDAATGAVIAEDGTTIGVATNNVAEYSGLIAGLRLAEEFAPDADVEVRMDSKLVVEQMSGRWKIKHPDMRPLATEANRLAPFGTTYTWVPREQNKHADRLANEALDGKRNGVTVAGDSDRGSEAAPTEVGSATDEQSEPRWVRWRQQVQTTLILVRHGVTEHTLAKKFSGGVSSANPALSDEGRAQIRGVADWLAPLAERVDAVVASPVRRARESGEILAQRLGKAMEEEPGFAEMDFGTWDGLTFEEVAQQYPGDLDTWVGTTDVRPGGGESLEMVRERVLEALDGVLARHVGGTVVVASHVTPIKVVVGEAVHAPLDSQFRMELRPASVTIVSFFTPPHTSAGDGPLPPREERHASLRAFNLQAPGIDLLDEPTRW